MDTVKIDSKPRDDFATALELAAVARSPEGVIEAFASQGAQALKAMARVAKLSRDRQPDPKGGGFSRTSSHQLGGRDVAKQGRKSRTQVPRRAPDSRRGIFATEQEQQPHLAAAAQPGGATQTQLASTARVPDPKGGGFSRTSSHQLGGRDVEAVPRPSTCLMSGYWQKF